MNSLRKISLALAFACACAVSAVAQSNPSTDVFYVRIDNLDVDNYATLHHTLKADGRFLIDLACVPAHLLLVKMVGERDADLSKNLAAFQALATNAQLANATLLPDFDSRKFTDACAATRVGN